MFDYLEHKEFLTKIYEQAVKDNEIIGWDLWSLKSGSEPDGFQYITITYYSDPVKMMNGNSPETFFNYAKSAFPDRSEEQISTILTDAIDIRDLAVRSYMMEIARTNDEFEFRPGILASFDLMKAVEDRFEEYERAEQEVFLPIHEKKIKAGLMENWSFLRTAVPTGSEASSTHMTMNVYSNYMQFFNSMEFEDLGAPESQQVAVEKGLKSRDQKWVYLANLESMVR